MCPLQQSVMLIRGQSYLTEREPIKMSHHGLGWLAVDVRYLAAHSTELGYEGETSSTALQELSEVGLPPGSFLAEK